MATSLPAPTRSASHRSSTTHTSSSRETITLVADDLSVGIMTVGGTGRITFINRAIERMLGYCADELVGEPLDVIIPPRMRGTYTEALRQFLATGEGAFPARTGVRLSAMHRAGHEVPLEVSFSDASRNGERHLTGVLRDLSVESETAEALRLSDARFRALTEASPLGTFVMDPESACIYANRAYQLISGSEPRDALGDGWRLLVHPDDLAHTVALNAEVITERTSKSSEVRYVRPDGSVVWTTVRLAPIVVDELVIGCLGTIEDITEQRASRELELGIGGSIQELFLHGELPAPTSSYSVGVVAEASRRLAGDFHDFFAHGDHVLDVVLGGVTGVGIPAALLAAATKSRLAREIALTTHGPDAPPYMPEVIARLDRSMGARLAAAGGVSTLCYARVDAAARRLELAGRGDSQVLHVRGTDGFARFVDGVNVPPGVATGDDLQTTRVPLGEGDVVVLYSDGLMESRSPDGRVFDAKRLMDVVRTYRREPAMAIARAVWRAVVKFTESLSAADDLTCIVVRVEPREAVVPEAQEWEADAVFPSLSHLRSFIRHFCERLNPRPDAAWENALVLATHEAAANVVRHDAIARRLFVTARVEGTTVEVRLSHDGAVFAPPDPVEPALEERHDHGYGLFLIRRNVDGMQYERDARQRPGVTLHKHLPPRAVDAPADLSHD